MHGGWAAEHGDSFDSDDSVQLPITDLSSILKPSTLQKGSTACSRSHQMNSTINMEKDPTLAGVMVPTEAENTSYIYTIKRIARCQQLWVPGFGSLRYIDPERFTISLTLYL